jgi:histidinol phosphatase-like enzyme
MVLQAQKDFQLDLPRCYLVGDPSAWDMLLAGVTGCRAVLVHTGLGESSLGVYRHTWSDFKANFIAEDVWKLYNGLSKRK